MVLRNFEEYVAGKGLMAIAEGLSANGILSPSAHDPARNRHRSSSGGAWSKGAVRAILDNPRYSGRQVWNRQRRDEVLVDVEDVALGHETKMRWNDRADWVWLADVVHELLLSVDLFERAQEQRSLAGKRATVVRPRRKNTYVLSGLLHCGVCERRMQGVWAHDRAYYRCRFPAEYADVQGRHERSVNVRKEAILPGLDRWLASIFDPEHLDETCESLAAADDLPSVDDARVQAARTRIADCDNRLNRYRAALEAGTDPVLVGKVDRRGPRRAHRRRTAARRRDARIEADQERGQGTGRVASRHGRGARRRRPGRQGCRLRRARHLDDLPP
ncbi:MAG: recombinase family protein [Acidimicrobiia bacterium]